MTMIETTVSSFYRIQFRFHHFERSFPSQENFVFNIKEFHVCKFWIKGPCPKQILKKTLSRRKKAKNFISSKFYFLKTALIRQFYR